MNDLQVFDPNALKDQVTSRIRSSFVELIPEEAFASLVQSELDKFFRPQFTERFGKTKEHPPLLHSMIQEALKKRLATEIDEMLSQDEWRTTFGTSHDEKPGEAVRAMMTELVPTFVEAMFSSIVQESIRKIQSGLSGGY